MAKGRSGPIGTDERARPHGGNGSSRGGERSSDRSAHAVHAGPARPGFFVRALRRVGDAARRARARETDLDDRDERWFGRHGERRGLSSTERADGPRDSERDRRARSWDPRERGFGGAYSYGGYGGRDWERELEEQERAMRDGRRGWGRDWEEERRHLDARGGRRVGYGGQGRPYGGRGEHADWDERDREPERGPNERSNDPRRRRGL